MRTIALATAAAATLIVVYLALGGASYAPAKVADPCARRHLRNPHGFGEVAERIVLSSLDDAACKLGVSREDIVLAFASRNALGQFAREHGISDHEAEELIRSSFVHAVDDAQRGGFIGGTTAALLRGIVQRVPVDELIALLRRLG
jgi:hypothetical protein